MARSRRASSSKTQVSAVPSADGPKPLGRLAALEVRDLLGDRNHEITFQGAEPTILTGANGTGKSTLLRLIYGAGGADWPTLWRLPFAAARLDFDSGLFLEMRKTDSTMRVQLGDEYWSYDPDASYAWDYSNLPSISLSTEAEPVARTTFEFDPADYELATFNTVASMWSNVKLPTVGHPPPEGLAALPERFPVSLISERRLIVERRRRGKSGGVEESTEVRTAVTEYARELADTIRNNLGDYAERSQSLDRAFPNEVVRAIRSSRRSRQEALQRLIEELVERREALQKVGLLEDVYVEAFDESALELPEVRPVIATFAATTLEKFQTLEDLRARLELFLGFLNQHYVNKQLVVDRENGFTAVLPTGERLATAALSSGEQQMLVLAYQILFRAKPGTLILIDEPELSLHVLWQHTLVHDLTRMGDARGLHFLLATHSPSLIGAREHLRRSLDARE
jgi:ABC-type transport system involved in cytochrome c biogenesis ATPase subunit